MDVNKGRALLRHEKEIRRHWAKWLEYKIIYRDKFGIVHEDIVFGSDLREAKSQ